MIAMLLLIIILHVFILSKLIFFPYPELFVYPYLTNHGLLPFKEILDQHFPGLMFLPLNFDNLGMNNEIIARYWLMGIVVITHFLLFFFAKHFLKSNYKVLLVNLLYLIWQPFFEGWVLWIDNFLPLFLLPAFFALYRKKFLIAGLFMGLGIVFKQTLIPLAGLILIYILWSEKNFRMISQYLLGLLPPIVLMILYFAHKGVLVDFWYWTIVFNLTVYASFGTQIPASIAFVTRVFVVYAVSFLVLIYKEKRAKVILILFLVGSLVGVFDRANFVHFQPSLPFAVLGTVLGFNSLSKKKVMLLLGFYLMIVVWWQNIFYKGHLSNKVFFFDEGIYALANKIKEFTSPGDKIFVFGAAPHLYQMADRLPAGDVFVFQFPWFLKVAEDRILQGLISDQPQIIISDRTVVIEGQKITDYAKKLDQYIQKNYQQIDRVGTTDILHLRQL